MSSRQLGPTQGCSRKSITSGVSYESKATSPSRTTGDGS